MCCGRAASGKLSLGTMAAPARFIIGSRVGSRQDFFWRSGRRVWRNTTTWKGSPGSGKVSTVPCARLRSPWNAWVPIRRTGGKNGRKRSLLVDGRGVPLSLVASGANVHDVKLLEPTLDQIVAPRPEPTETSPQYLCGDAGYKGQPAQQAAVARKYQPHIKQRREEASAKREGYRPRRWVVERTHSWLNRYRKLLVSFEKTEAGYLGLLSLAAGLICWRQTTFIYG